MSSISALPFVAPLNSSWIESYARSKSYSRKIFGLTGRFQDPKEILAQSLGALPS